MKKGGYRLLQKCERVECMERRAIYDKKVSKELTL